MAEEFDDFIGGPGNKAMFLKTQDAIKRRTEAAINAVFAAMPWGLKIDLPGGEDATLEKFYAPKQKDGVWMFGFDVCDTTGAWHLEFCAEQSGWGGAPCGKMDAPDIEPAQ